MTIHRRPIQIKILATARRLGKPESMPMWRNQSALLVIFSTFPANILLSFGKTSNVRWMVKVTAILLEMRFVTPQQQPGTISAFRRSCWIIYWQFKGEGKPGPQRGARWRLTAGWRQQQKNPLVAVMKETIIRYNGNPSRAILCSLVLYCLQWVLLGFRRSYSRFSYGKPSEEAL